MAGETVLSWTGDGVSPFSARGLTQTLEPIDAAGYFRRTVNGALVNLSPTQFRKYRSRISCRDGDPPALDGVNVGTSLTVNCAATLSYLTGGSPSRGVVGGSSFTSGSYTIYRPVLTMLVVRKSQSFDEYGAVNGWDLDLEET